MSPAARPPPFQCRSSPSPQGEHGRQEAVPWAGRYRRAPANIGRVVPCANAPCKNSGIAAHRLSELGYARVRDYHERKADWIAAGYAVVSGAAVAA
jgi:hypothetical protein